MNSTKRYTYDFTGNSNACLYLIAVVPLIFRPSLRKPRSIS